MFHLVMAFIGATLGLLVMTFFFTAVTDGLCEGLTEAPEEVVEACESTVSSTWLVVAIFPVAIFFVIFTTFGGRGFATRTISIQNVEERVKKMQRLGIAHILKATKAQLIDESKRGNKLYAIKDKLVPNYTLKYLVYSDPSSPEKTYGCFIPSDVLTADKGMAWKFQITEEEYKDLEVEA